MKSITIIRDNNKIDIPVILVKQPSVNEVLRENIGTIYAPSIVILLNPNIDILNSDIILWNNYELGIKAILDVTYQGKNYLRKVVCGK